MPTTRSQSKAMSTPQVSPAQQEPESPKSTSSQESPESTISQETPRNIPYQNSKPSLDNLLSPGWIHAIPIIMGHPLKSEVGQKLQKWVLYDLIHDPTGFWLSWDPTDSEDIRFNRKCCKGTFKAPCLVALRMLLQLTYCCLHNQCEY